MNFEPCFFTYSFRMTELQCFQQLESNPFFLEQCEKRSGTDAVIAVELYILTNEKYSLVC